MPRLYHHGFALIACLALAPSSHAETTPAASPDAVEKRYHFTVSRNGSDIGHHNVTVTREGNRTIAEIDIHLAVSFGPVVVYRYRHENREEREGDTLISMVSSTDDDGDKQRVVARRDGDSIAVRDASDTVVASAPLTIIPTTYWQPQFAEQTKLLNSQTAEVVNVTMEQLGTDTLTIGGRSIPAQRIRIGGDLAENNITLWYTENNEWVKLAFEMGSSAIEYRLSDSANILDFVP